MTFQKKPIGLAVLIETYGCQMNKYDSEVIAGILTSSGYRITTSMDDADVILINTCSVRNHAEIRARGRINVLRQWKTLKPHRMLGVVGCMAQRLGAELTDAHTHVDLVVGPDRYTEIPGMLDKGRESLPIQTLQDHCTTYDGITPYRQSGICGWIAISRGCNNFCAYCIVPYTRGRERSRPARHILNELENMAANGFRDITLLGQNVNSYTDGKYDFADLLKMVADVPDILRIRFLTSHPKDLTQKIIDVLASEEKLCSHIHLPLQSGSNHVLERMNRGYTREDYLKRIDMARKAIPHVGLTTDILAGFPGETAEDFRNTLAVMKDVRFDNAFTYRYSPRTGTAAARMPDQIPEQERLNRLKKIIDLQRKITHGKKETMIGRVVTVLPEASSKQSQDEWMGRTETDHAVIFPKNNVPIGTLSQVQINTLSGSTLKGTCVSHQVNDPPPEAVALRLPAEPGGLKTAGICRPV